MDNKYTFRSLRFEEEITNFLMCKNFFNSAPHTYLPKVDFHFGRNILDMVGAHITRGNNTITPWISITTDMYTALRYSEKSEFRSSIAVIKNHNKDELKSYKYYEVLDKYEKGLITEEEFINKVRSLEMYEIQKMVLDFRYGHSKKFNDLINKKLVHLGNGKDRTYITTFEHNYSYANSELLVLGEIYEEDFVIFDPLQFDILVTILELYKNRIVITDELIDFIKTNFSINHSAYIRTQDSPFKYMNDGLINIFNKLSYIDQHAFYDLYINRMNIKGYSEYEEIMPQETIVIKTRLILNILDLWCKENNVTNNLPTELKKLNLI